MEKFNLIFSGELLEGFEVEWVRETLARRFKMGPEKIDRLLQGKRIVLKKDMEHAAAYRLSEALIESGLDTKLERSAIQFSTANLSLQEKPEEDKQAELEEARAAQKVRAPGDLPVVDGKIECPKCGHRQTPATECAGCGIVFAKYMAMQAQEDSEDDDAEEWQASESTSFAGKSRSYVAPKASWSEALGAGVKVVIPIVAVLLVGWKIWNWVTPQPPSKSEIYDYYQNACFVDAQCKQLLSEQFDECYPQAEPERMEEFSEHEMMNGFLEFANRLNQCIVYPDGTRVYYQFDELDAALIEELQERN